MELSVARKLYIKLASAAILVLLAASCGSNLPPAPTPTDLDLKLNILIEANNLKITANEGLSLTSIEQAEAQLGKRLFFSTLLSGGQDTACASCHHPLLLGTENISLPVGINSLDPNIVGLGRRHNINSSDDPKADGAPNVPRHSPTTFNSALYRKALFWDGRIEKNPQESGIITPESLTIGTIDTNAKNSLLATQALFPITSTQEMKGFHADHNPNTVRNNIISALIFASSNGNYSWAEDFRNTYKLSPSLTDAQIITQQRLASALAAYQESQLFIDNAWLKYINGNLSAIPETAKKGAFLFYAPSAEGGLNCVSCHSSSHFTDEKFHIAGFPQLGRGKAAQGTDFGRFHATKNEQDRYAFRTPSLLNTALTPPYGHAGSFSDLASLLKYHSNPRVDDYDFTLSTLAQFSGSGYYYPLAKENTRTAIAELNKNPSIKPAIPLRLTPSAEQISNITRFLETLSDSCLLTVKSNNNNCLSPWLLNNSEEKIDHMLQAKFNVVSNNNLGWKVPRPSTSIPTTPSISNGAKSEVNSCIINTKKTNISNLMFTEESIAAGISYDVPFADITVINSSQTSLFPKLDLLNSASFSGAVISADINADSYPDLISYQGPTRSLAVYTNNKNGGFTNTSNDYGLPYFSNKHIYGIASADLDGDRDIDLVITGRRLTPDNFFTTTGFMEIFKFDNNQWVHQPQSKSVVYPVHSVSFSDFNSDQNIDLNIASWSLIANDKKENHLWKNTGDLQYTPASIETGLESLMPERDFTFLNLSTDLDGNFHPDLVQISDFGNSGSFFNNGNGQFVSQNSNGHKNQFTDDNGMGAVSADFNNDGHMDIFVTSIYGAELTEAFRGTGNRLYLNDGTGKLTDISTSANVRNGRWGWAACAADFNLDGHLDIFQVNGFGGLLTQDSLFKNSTYYSAFLNDKSKLFISNGNMTFSESAVALGIDDSSEGRGVVCFDYDRDGDTDIFINVNGGKPKLYKNNINDGSGSLTIEVIDQKSKNTQAIGARLKITNKRTGESQYREIQANSNYQSQSPTSQIIGLAKSSDLYAIEVTWPRPFLEKTTIDNIAPNQCLSISRQP